MTSERAVRGAWLRDESPLLAVLAGAILGVLLSIFVDWEAGLVVLGLDLIAGAALRLLLPDVRVGLLAVRSRTIDAVLLIFVGGALIAITASLGRAG